MFEDAEDAGADDIVFEDEEEESKDAGAAAAHGNDSDEEEKKEDSDDDAQGNNDQGVEIATSIGDGAQVQVDQDLFAGEGAAADEEVDFD